MVLPPGARIGPFEIVALIGAGGMGRVYRARDPRLGRDVAIKVALEHFSDRFAREAHAVAALNHPNITTLHDVGPDYLVMELVDGETLAERIRRGALPIDDAVAIARQIIAALEAAHERGIVHRDLKPGNVKIKPDGTVKVLDFGLAKISDSISVDSSVYNEPTRTREPATSEGLVLGTAAYMSPEQARGRAIDKRTDIWALGCLLYEMLTGVPPFRGASIPDTLGAILTQDPDWARLPPSTSAAVRRLLRRCLEKDVQRRLRDIGDARIELDEAPEADFVPAQTLTPATRLSRAAWIIGSLGALACVGLAAWLWTLSWARTEVTPLVTRTTVTLPTNQELDTVAAAFPLAIAPDGRRLAYVARSGGGTLLYLRDLDAFEARPLIATESARYPFFSPDGQTVGFFADGSLKRVSVSGGAPSIICAVPITARSGAWGPDGTIVIDPGERGLLRVAASGGTPEPVTSQDTGMDSRDLDWPQFLPGARALLVTAGLELAVLSLDTGRWHTLGPGRQGRYLTSGHVIYHAPQVREGELQVVAFDVERLALRGSPVAVLDSVFRSPGGGSAYYGVSENGMLVFAPGGLSHTLVRVDRNGRRTPLVNEHRGFRFPRLSPDGRRIAVTIDPRPSQVWVYDVMRGTRIPLSSSGHNIASLWTRDGARVVYYSKDDLYWRDANGTGAEERLLRLDGAQYPMSWSADGQLVFVDHSQSANRGDIAITALGGEPRKLVGTLANEQTPMVSPDGRWLAYTSDETGHLEVFVRPFPDVERGKWPISTAGGHSPLWSRDGREIFYMSGNAMMAVRVETRGNTFLPNAPELLFTGPFDTTQDHNFDVAPDESSFVMVEADQESRPTRLQVVVNWFEELKQRVPSR
jgi:serine/threonine-protein kinase